MATTPHAPSNETPTLSRRAVLGASLATLGYATAVAVPAVAGPNPASEASALDPALVAIRKCQDALEAYGLALHEQEFGPEEYRYDLEDRADEAMDASLDAWRALFDVTPATPAGAAALATYMLWYHRNEGGADTAEEALEGLAGCLHRMATATA